ncbi:MAG: DUF3179 domain-containing protein, partial [Rhodothermales bacterium]
IPALTDPPLVAADEVTYLRDDSRIIGLVIDGMAIAVPHNILWWHEIANLNFSDRQVAVTFCPLTGSSLVFDRTALGGAEFGVSGLLFKNNLVMYDRRSDESLWPQMVRAAGCGPSNGTSLPMAAALEMTWAGWRGLYPETRVVSGRTGFNRDYSPSGYPYGNYDRPDNPSVLFSLKIDQRRPPKERVLGIPGRTGGIAFPFGSLHNGAPFRVAHVTLDERAIVVFWDAARQGAMAYDPVAGGETLGFEVRDDGIFDTSSGTRWLIDGRADSGPLAGSRLTPIAEAYVAFWFAWAEFHPETILWSPDS